ncbi:hypothetical protein ACFOTA_22365 [Chitinophaga sp. GCM10012297]|uniref:Lipoprotein n=1 Tax=Chitinophaga chungangae TaxID=2821488 RepID=A0ABS3YJW4_9BACT|nr:hypothetical protein [Chitinophaga chungangae]MBO9154977.1 hypothetical protein [Chitinophaga chungangae]
MNFRKLLCWGLLPLCLSCSRPRETHRAFYYWKQRYEPGSAEKTALRQLHVKKLYVKCFDVSWNETDRSAVPVAITDFKEPFPDSLEIVPVVFLMNEIWRQKDTGQARLMAERTASLLASQFAQTPAHKIREIQLDCDWTRSSRDVYFSFLQHLRRQPFFSGREMSATIRLHQVKFLSASGVPPADKGLLMCYNMGDLRKPGDHNSILNMEELKAYTGNDRISNYPLPLDLALPLFEWTVLFRNNRYKGLLRQLPLENRQLFRKEGEFTYTVLRDTALQNTLVRRGDVVRYESCSPETLRKAARYLNRQRQPHTPAIIFYHLDPIIFQKYTVHELETIYHLFE